MDEVDIDNAEDLNELEARLYAQIHHEANGKLNDTQNVEDGTKAVNSELGTAEGNNSVSEEGNRSSSKRYWASGNDGQQQNTKYRVRNPNNNKEHVAAPILKTNKEDDGTSNQKESRIDQTDQDQNIKDKSRNSAYYGPSFNAKSPSNCESNNHLSTTSKNKPQREAFKRVKNPFVRREAHAKEVQNLKVTPKQGPFFKQQQKLQKIKRIEQKKQKSKKVIAKKQTTAIDIVDLVSSDESDSSDVIMIPKPPTPTFSLDDSDDERSTKMVSILEHEENAVDSTDVKMSSGSSSFIKPQTPLVDDKRIENSSRCTSPCSIQSSDDFIGQKDRSRLIEAGSGMADDEDLLFLTTDVHSLLDTPQSRSLQDKHINTLSNNTNINSNDETSFATPTATSFAETKSDYRVEGQFRAIDVYESESDLTESVYSKGATKTTVIRKIDSSSDDVEDITCTNHRTKRLRKRRRSSGNKISDQNNENNSGKVNSDDDDGDEENSNSGTERTGIPFISRGPAVERKTKKRRSTLSTSMPQKTPGKTAKSGHMSDGDFIAKLNDLVQGQDEDDEIVDSDDEVENTPSAREIAEKILGEKDKVVAKELALPQNVCNKLTDVFEVIDQMENDKDPERIEKTKENEIPHCRQLKAVLYQSLPEEDNAQILTFVEDATPSSSNGVTLKKYADDGSPVYNVVYSRGRKLDGGLGWNDEMRKFYQNSWNGEGFVLKDVWKNMNPDRNLWKISNEDRYQKQNKRHSNLKCTNCCEFGHARFQCKRPMKPRICYMCGESGHQEPRCPKTLCLRCGNKTQFFVKSCNACSFQNRLICPICKIRGHSIDHCPDKWRRYHSTTEPNAFPNNTVVYNQRKHCSICGHRGHLADSCRNAVNFMEYPILATTIKSHQKSYNDTAVKTPFGGIGFNLMYEPCLRYSFDMSQRTTNEKYYGRFLNAVGLSFLMSHKRALNSPEAAISSSSKKAKKAIKTNETKTSEGANAAPNQVPEVTESGSVDLEEDKRTECCLSTEDVVESTVLDNDIQLNVVNTASVSRISQNNFKSPSNVSLSSNPPQVMDSDSNYSFSEHFDDTNASTSTVTVMPKETETPSNPKSKSRPMETLPEFIPLVDSTREEEDPEADKDDPKGISRRFVAAESDEEDDEDIINKAQQESNFTGHPCEAKIYLTQLHSKYLLSPDGRQFLEKASKSCHLKVRLDFTSVGHVLVIFGLPDNQDKFQRELLLKYRDISNHIQTKELQPIPNVPKRTDVLIRFLRDDINQLLSNLGNVNHLYKRLQFVERQQSKSGLKLADKLRRSLNMILVGQAGLQDGNMHLDKLINSLKILLNDYNAEDVTPLALRAEITAHWKVIFSSYRHNNYDDLIHNYNNLITKNRIPKLIIDPLLLGHKVLDTNLTQEQKEKMEQAIQVFESPLKANQSKVDLGGTPKNNKQNKRQQSASAISNATNSPTLANKLQNTQAKTPFSQAIRPYNVNIATPTKNKLSGTNLLVTPNSSAKKQQHQKIPPPPPFINPEICSNASTSLAELSDKWRSTCDTILTEITSKPLQRKDNNAIRESKLPSTFWSRESMRYLNECVYIAASRPELMEKIKRVQTKSKNGQLSYNDYLAVIKLHTALASK